MSLNYIITRFSFWRHSGDRVSVAFLKINCFCSTAAVHINFKRKTQLAGKITNLFVQLEAWNIILHYFSISWISFFSDLSEKGKTRMSREAKGEEAWWLPKKAVPHCLLQPKNQMWHKFLLFLSPTFLYPLLEDACWVAVRLFSLSFIPCVVTIRIGNWTIPRSK